ncbi:phage tail protein [Lactobacillus sp. S2-2]|uniref:phage tail tube protein n=1 Tax=Lactobacillus sp. S2-2 TaxID=2692917 RepID=UPI001F469DC7|nr:phage tail tube protein [Lactobacillus sp. S2-2]MCF6515555.1 phage tail protein [Lactobacillus sp. S2-2]
MENYLNGRDTISTKDAIVYLTLHGEVKPMIECKKVTIKISKNKEDIQTLGSHWKRKKVTSVEGTGTLGGYLVNSNWLKYALPYLTGGQDLYFDMSLSIEDKTTANGRQTVHIGYVNLDDIPVADFEADDGVMEYESDFTFESLDLVESFN